MIDKVYGIINITGTSGDDTIIGNDSVNNFTTGAGKDTVYTGAGADVISLGTEDDKVIFRTTTESKNDVIDGGSGSYDELDYSALSTGITLSLNTSTYANVIISGENDHQIKNIENVKGVMQDGKRNYI